MMRCISCLLVCISYVYTQMPSSPRNVTVTEVNSKSIDIRWEAPVELSGVVTKFRVVYSFDVDGYKKEKTLLLNGTSSRTAELKRLYPFILYNIEVSEKIIEYGPPAKIVVRTSQGVPQAAPGNFAVAEFNSSSAKLTWEAIPTYLRGGNLTKYQLLLSGAQIFSTHKYSPDTLSALLSGLKANTTYTAVIMGVTTSSSDTHSQVKFTTKLPAFPPRNLTSSEVTDSSFLLTWIAPQPLNNITSYLIKLNTGSQVESIELKADRTSYTITELEPETLYSVEMLSFNTEFSEVTNPIQFTTLKSAEKKKVKQNVYLYIFIPVCLVILIALIIGFYICRKKGAFNVPKKKFNEGEKKIEPTEENHLLKGRGQKV